MLPVPFLRANFRWLLGGYLMAFTSSFGQTFFIALFAGHFRSEFDLSHGGFGGVYAVATLAAAISLVWLGKFADNARLFGITALTLILFAGVVAATGATSSAAMLLAAIYGLRLLGQGMISHIALTAMARWFDKERGRSISLAALGYTSGEFLLPTIGVLLIASFGWRESWWLLAAFTLLVLMPAILACLWNEPSSASPDRPTRDQDTTPPEGTNGADRGQKRSWTRSEVLKDPIFYAVIISVMAPAFIVTGTFFNQVHLADIKGWSLDLVATGFMVFAVTQILTALITGYLIDKISAVRLLPTYLWPLGLAMMTIAFGSGTASLFVMMFFMGVTTAAGSTLFGALWAELYGLTHLGRIRALTMAAMIVFSALSPGLIGLLLDYGIAFERQALFMAFYTVLASITLLILQPRLKLIAQT